MTIEIELTQGQVALVDDADAILVQGRKWCAWRPSRRGAYYAATSYRAGPNKWRTVLMHRVLIAEVPPGFVVDHINGNGTDNRRANLRVCSRTENNRSFRQPIGRSRYRGVVLLPHGSWMSQIKCDGRRHYLGSFADEQDAARAYDAAAVRLFGEMAHLNFPE